ncbi:hypothetical protein Pdw03_6163 [Penicillium digitatum]|uniref:Uncharacterized protein n=1 Tax=Penicillium digitatum TaxID=36651 RepID=A0A7T7BJN4_PENDI|nr:hypothetical protein Pdw03_6163 [Penicillium digitatum]
MEIDKRAPIDDTKDVHVGTTKGLDEDLPPTPSQPKPHNNIIQLPSIMCTRTHGPVKYNCGHIVEHSTVVPCDKNCGVTKDAQLGMTTKRNQACPNCTANKEK